ncbi:MAG: SGNH/GDSL hydrolase family protein [Chthoniobacteraceae bacterium]
MKWLCLCLLLATVEISDGESGLGRIWQKVDREQRLTIGYLGGSITAGAGASQAAKTSWRAEVTNWFCQRYPRALIKEINAGLGGTGSNLGAYRCQHDLLAGKPDLVFVEFAVNDANTPKGVVQESMEGIVRQVRQSNPQTAILFIYSANKYMDATYHEDGTPQAVLSKEEVARHYGLSSINVGKGLWDAIQAGDGTWETLTKDGTHPNDAGYAIYTKQIVSFLESSLEEEVKPPAPMPPPMTPNPVVNASLADAWDANAPGWERENKSMSGRWPHLLSCQVSNQELCYDFEGTGIGLYWLVSPDSGDIVYTIDDSPWQKAPCWDKYALNSTRVSFRILTNRLPAGVHHLRLKVAEAKPTQSTGTWIRIGAFLVHHTSSSKATQL